MEDLQYIIDLYTDADPKVAAALDKYFLDNGPAAMSQLRSAYGCELVPDRKALIGKMIARYNKMLVMRGLGRIAERPDECSLIEAGYLMCALTDATLSREAYIEQIMPIVMAVTAEVSDAKTALENVTLLNHVFYKKYGFSVSSPFDMTLESSLLMNVLSNRKGSPFALSLLYFIIAQTAGLPVYPLCFTGGFVPVYEENGKVLFNINVFHQGEIFMENNISKIVQSQASAMGVNVDIGEAVVKKDHSILVMYLEFLQMLYSNSGDSVAQMDIDDAIEILGGKRYLTIESDEDEW